WFNTYIINPDGSEGLTPFVVFCTMTDKNGVGVTVVSLDSENRMLVYRLFSHWSLLSKLRMLVDRYKPTGSYVRNISYL
ncbi:unnamed protein product, partial [Porites evermanni]